VSIDDEACLLEIMDYCWSAENDYGAYLDRWIRRVHGFVLVFDITSPKSLEVIEKEVLPRLQNVLEVERISAVLVGNKLDLEDKRKMAPAEGAALAEKHGWQYFEASAMNRINVDECFLWLASDINKKCKGKEKKDKLTSLPPKRCCIM